MVSDISVHSLWLSIYGTIVNPTAAGAYGGWGQTVYLIVASRKQRARKKLGTKYNLQWYVPYDLLPPVGSLPPKVSMNSKVAAPAVEQTFP